MLGVSLDMTAPYLMHSDVQSERWLAGEGLLLNNISGSIGTPTSLRVAEHSLASAGWAIHLQQISQADHQHFMELGVKLRYGDAPTMESACRALLELIPDYPAAALLIFPPLRDGILHALGQGERSATSWGCALASQACSSLVQRLNSDEASPCTTRSFDCTSQKVQAMVLEAVSLLLGELLRSGLRCAAALPSAVDGIEASLSFIQRKMLAAQQGTAIAKDAVEPAARDTARACPPGASLTMSWRLCVQVVSDVLHAALLRQEVSSLLQALNWFKACGLALPMEEQIWKTPLVSHEWTLQSLAVFDVWMLLLSIPGSEESLAGVASTSPNLSSLLSVLLLDYRLLCERPHAAKLLCEAASRAGCRAAQEFQLFCELSEAMDYGAGVPMEEQGRRPLRLLERMQVLEPHSPLQLTCADPEQRAYQRTLDHLGLLSLSEDHAPKPHSRSSVQEAEMAVKAEVCGFTLSFWDTRLGRQTVALLQLFRSLQHILGSECPWHIICSSTAGGMDSAGATPQAAGNTVAEEMPKLCPAFQRAKQRVVRARSREEFAESLKDMLVQKTEAATLIDDSAYFARLLMELSQITSVEVLRGPSHEDASDLCMLLLTHLHAVTRLALHFGGGGKLQKPLAELVKTVCRQLLPAIETAVLGGKPLHPKPAASPSHAETALTFQHAHGALASNLRLQLASELVLSVALGLLQMFSVSVLASKDSVVQPLLAYQWQDLLPALISSSAPSLRRLAITIAATAVPRAGTAGIPMCKIVAAVANRMELVSTCPVSLHNSFELKVGLTLLTDLALAEQPLGDDLLTRTVENCARQCLGHTDSAVQVSAWRLLRRSRAYRAVSTSPGIDDISLFAAAVRALEVDRVEGADDPSLGSAGETLVFAEVFDFITSTLELLEASQDIERHQACFRRVFEIGVLVSKPFQRCLGSLHLGCPLAALRFLAALLRADAPQVRATLLQESVWTRIVSDVRLQADSTQSPESHARHVDNAEVVGALLVALAEALDSDFHLLLWLSHSTELLELWQLTLARLVAVPEPESHQALCAVGKATVASKQWTRVMLLHLNGLKVVMNALKQGGLGSGTQAERGVLDVSRWAIVVHFLRCKPVWEVVCRELAGLQNDSGLLALEVVGELCSISLLGVDLSPSHIEVEEQLGIRVCSLFRGAQVEQPELPLVLWCLSHVVQSLPAAALSAIEDGLLQTLAHHIGLLTSSCLAAPTPRPASVRSLLWTLRLFSALLTSTSDACIQEAEQVLVDVAEDIRAVADKDDTVCLEFLGMLATGLQEGRETDLSLSDGEQVHMTSNGVRSRFVAFLAHTEMLQWVMRLSLKRSVGTAVYCKSMEVLALSAEALSGKPLLQRYLCKISTALRKECKVARNAGERQIPAEEAADRFVATLHFIAALRLSSNCLSLLVASVPAAHLGEKEVVQATSLGMDFWIDMLDPDHSAAASARAAASQAWLSMVLSETPAARTFLSQSERGIRLLVRQLTCRDGALSTLALFLIWGLCFQNQRVVPLLKRLSIEEQLKTFVSYSKMPDEDEFGAEDQLHQQQRMKVLAAQQIATIVRLSASSAAA
mmetsp:Transcript_36208/g.84919  ORF Transcript_36208/g.84919 Transcript_36208/m.84919 type:complete len:1575 (+) Transcript_36208:145-4869(+)